MSDGGSRPHRSRITSHDVARAAGVSQSAVSRAFARAPGVSEPTRARIVRIAEEMGYQPNALASGLITRKSGIVGVVLSQLTNPFLTEATDCLIKALRRKRLQGLVFSASGTGELGDAAADFGRYRVDGCFVLSPHLSRGAAAMYARLGPTVILFNRSVPGMAASTVSVDNKAAGALVADHLVARGHTRFGYVHCNPESTNDHDRFGGFARRLKLLGGFPLIEIDGGPHYPDTTTAVTAMLGRDDRPSAVFCSNDLTAMATVDVARFQYGLTIPDDVAIVGFDDAPTAAWPSYDLTTIRQPIADMVDAGIALLRDSDQSDEPPPQNLVFTPELIVRGSA
ncbi:MAG: LacI family DNA-binding transcriptional regulator [Alphaproteobacteria bacterium]